MTRFLETVHICQKSLLINLLNLGEIVDDFVAQNEDKIKGENLTAFKNEE